MASLELIYACEEKLGPYKLNKIFYPFSVDICDVDDD
jgi:hypothetical protein